MVTVYYCSVLFCFSRFTDHHPPLSNLLLFLLPFQLSPILPVNQGINELNCNSSDNLKVERNASLRPEESPRLTGSPNFPSVYIFVVIVIHNSLRLLKLILTYEEKSFAIRSRVGKVPAKVRPPKMGNVKDILYIAYSFALAKKKLLLITVVLFILFVSVWVIGFIPILLFHEGQFSKGITGEDEPDIVSIFCNRSV